MLLKDLRSVVGEQTRTNVIVEADSDNVTSGDLWFFSVDESIDGLEVKSLKPKDDVLEITLACSPQTLRDTDWSSTFNQDAIVSMTTDSSDILTQQDEEG